MTMTDSTGTTTPQPMPTSASADLAIAAINGLRAEFAIQMEAVNTRFMAMDKAVALQHEDLVRVPTDVMKTTTALRDYLEEKIGGLLQQINSVLGREIERLNGRIDTLSEKNEERFKGIQTQFTLLKEATTQLDLTNKTAIERALNAQKESAAETQKSSQAAVAKSEASTTESIKTLTVTLQQQFGTITDRINDLKGRLDRGEGGREKTDPAIAETLQRMANAIASLQTTTHTSEGKQAGKDYTVAIVLTLLGIAVPAIGLLLVIAGRMH
jgi:chromosome segregation ATPase